MFRVQGSFLCHIRPAFLLDIKEFKHWCSLQVQFFVLRQHYGFCLSQLECHWCAYTIIKFIHSAPLTVKWERKEFWLQLCWLRVSEQTILDWCPAANLQGGKSNSLVSLMLSDFQSHHWLFLQVLVLSRVSKSNVNNSFDHKIMDGIFQFNPLSLASNIYSCRELRLLSWVNMHYQTSRETVWKKGRTHSMCTYIITSS